MITGLAIPSTQGPNYAPAKPLESYYDKNGREQKPYPEWIKIKTTDLERLEDATWRELSLTWQLMNMFINGDQLAVRGHRTGVWSKVPMPTTTTAPVRQQNKLGFYSRVLMSKWVASRTKLKAVAGDDSDQTAGAVRSAQIFADVIQPIVYSEMFRQQEGLAGQAHGTYARYFYYDEEADGGYTEDPITEPRNIQFGGGIGSCYECGYVGSAGEFAGSGQIPGGQLQDSNLAGNRDAFNAQYGHDELAEWEAGLEAPHPPEEEEYEENEPSHLAATGGFDAAGVADAPNASTEAGASGFSMGQCPSCGSPNVAIEEPETQEIEVVTGTQKRKLGQMRAISVPYTQLRHEIACSAEESPWLRWKRRCRIEEVQAQFPKLRITPTPNNNDRDPGLMVEESLRRSVAQTGAPRTWAAQQSDDQYTNFTQWWLTPVMYADYVFPAPVETVAGEQIPAGAKAAELFPDGMYIAMVEGVDAPVQIRNECHKWHWVTAPYRLQMFSGLGIGINDAMEMQRQWNVTLSLVFEQIRSSSLPGWLYDKDAISPDDVRLLGQPQNSVPVSTRNRQENTRLEQLVHQMTPGQLPSHIPWYIGQLDANMQTSTGALVNEGVPGMDSKTATGAELMNSASNQHNAPEFALKGDADTRSMVLLFDLAKKHYVEPRYLPLSGKRGKQDGIWLSKADFENGQVRWEAVTDTWLPSTKMDKQQAIQGMLLAVGGPLIFMQLLTEKPEIAQQLMEVFGVDADAFDDEYAATSVLCRQRADQVKQLAQQAQPLLMQAQQMAAMYPPVAQIDPTTGQVMPPPDPTQQLAEQIIQNLNPPPVLEEPGHKIAMDWYREILIDDEIKEADELTRACIQALIRMEAQMMMEEASILGQMQMMAQPMPPGGAAPGNPPQKTEKDKRKDNARSQMGPSGQGQNSRPAPAMGAV